MWTHAYGLLGLTGYKKKHGYCLSKLISFWGWRPIQKKCPRLLFLSTLIRFYVRRPSAEFPRLFFCPLLLGWTIGLSTLILFVQAYCKKKVREVDFGEFEGSPISKKVIISQFHVYSFVHGYCFLSTLIVFGSDGLSPNVHAYSLGTLIRFWGWRPIQKKTKTAIVDVLAY